MPCVEAAYKEVAEWTHPARGRLTDRAWRKLVRPMPHTVLGARVFRAKQWWRKIPELPSQSPAPDG
jgi:hypothetical protein